MFGGVTFMVAGHMCCGVAGDELVVRVGADGTEEAAARRYARPCDFTGRPMKGMLTVTAEGYRTKAALAGWVATALAFVDSLPPRR